MHLGYEPKEAHSALKVRKKRDKMRCKLRAKIVRKRTYDACRVRSARGVCCTLRYEGHKRSSCGINGGFNASCPLDSSPVTCHLSSVSFSHSTPLQLDFPFISKIESGDATDCSSFSLLPSLFPYRPSSFVLILHSFARNYERKPSRNVQHHPPQGLQARLEAA